MNRLELYLSDIINGNPASSVFGLVIVLLILALLFNVRSDEPKRAKGDDDL